MLVFALSYLLALDKAKISCYGGREEWPFVAVVGVAKYKAAIDICMVIVCWVRLITD